VVRPTHRGSGAELTVVENEEVPAPTRSKIVCTIGPACESEEMLSLMADAGMDMARLNLSHGTLEDHERRFVRIRKLLPDLPIMMDLEGPRVRIGDMKDQVTLEPGQKITLTAASVMGNRDRVSVTLPSLPRAVTPGQRIFINDGIVELRVEDVKGDDIHCTVFTGGPISSHKGVNVPGLELGMTVPTKQDAEHLRFIAKLNADYVAVSAVKRRSELDTIASILQKHGVDIPIISKIEHRKAVDNFLEILDVSYGVMVARGDLGVEIPPEHVPLIQKEIIHKCNQVGKPVIVATQMLESMVENPRPTRAETSDVANAILDGADALMLSAETAVGKHPFEAVRAMDTIARYVESSYPQRDPAYYHSGQHAIAEELGAAVVSIVQHLAIKTVLVFTKAGYSARMVSKYRPPARIIAATPHERVWRQLRLLWGAETLLIKQYENADLMLTETVKRLVNEGTLTPDERFVVVRSSVLVPGKTNLVGIFTVNDILSPPPTKPSLPS
jgi:pyruvate kinase